MPATLATAATAAPDSFSTEQPTACQTTCSSTTTTTTSVRDPDEFILVGREVKIAALKVHANHLELHYTLDDSHSFITKVLYPAGTLPAFREKYGSADPTAVGSSPTFSRRLFCHIALIESLKFIATFPRTLDISVVADGLSQSSLDFFTLASSRAWSQHFYENGVHDYHGPRFLGTERLATTVEPISQEHSAGEIGGGILCANGGGKDSFLALKLLEECNFPVHVFQHARTEYGRFDHQHAIQRKFHPHIDALREGRGRVHEISIQDDFTDGSLMALLNPDLRGDAIKGYPCQVGWPEMCLPFSTLLARPDGTTIAVEDVTEGMALVGQDGKQVVVAPNGAKKKQADGLFELHSLEGDADYSATEEHKVTLMWLIGPSISVHAGINETEFVARLSYYCADKTVTAGGESMYLRKITSTWPCQPTDTHNVQRHASRGADPALPPSSENDDAGDGGEFVEEYSLTEGAVDGAKPPLDQELLTGTVAEIKEFLHHQLRALVKSGAALLSGDLIELTAQTLFDRQEEFRIGKSDPRLSGRRVPLPTTTPEVEVELIDSNLSTSSQSHLAAASISSQQPVLRQYTKLAIADADGLIQYIKPEAGQHAAKIVYQVG